MSPTTPPAVPPTAPPSPAPQQGRPILDAADWMWHRPWLLLVALAAVVTWFVGRNLLASWRHRRLVRDARWISIAPPPEVEPTGADALWSTLTGVLAVSTWRRLVYGTPHVVFEYTWTGRQLTISLWVPGTIPPGAVEAAIRAAWPGAATTSTAPAPPPLPTDVSEATGGALTPTLPDYFALKTDHDTDPLRPLVAAGAEVRHTEHACVQILARPASRRRIRRARRAPAQLRHHQQTTGGSLATIAARAAVAPLQWGIDVFLPGTPRRNSHQSTGPTLRDPTVERDVRAALDKTTATPLWETAIRYAVAATPTRRPTNPTQIRERLRGLAHTIASAFATHTGRNTLHRLRLRRPVETLATRRLRYGFLLSTGELAALAALPTDVAVPGLDRARAKPAPAPVAIPGGGRNTKVLGTAEIGGHSVSLPVADARQHLHIVGKTGAGKSTLLLNLVLGDIRAHRGVVVIDPRGDLITDILDRIPTRVADRVYLIDPDQPNPDCFNPLDNTDDPHLAVDNIVGIFSKIFARHWGPRIDDTLRVACLTLMQHPHASLTLVPPLLNDDQFRARFTVHLDDPEGLHGYWRWYDSMNPPLRAQVIGPVLARLRAFLLRDFVKHVIGGTTTPTIDMRRILDRGGILLCRLPKGLLGEDTARILGSLVVARTWQAATARASQPEHQRRDATLYIDECHNFLNLPGAVGDMLAEARGYHLSLTLAHQHLAQLPKEVAAAASANARNKIYFTVAPEDAVNLAKHTHPELDDHDLAHLDAHTAAARLVVNHRDTPAFTFRTRQPPPLVGEQAAVRAVCTARNTPTSPPPPNDHDLHDGHDDGKKGNQPGDGHPKRRHRS